MNNKILIIEDDDDILEILSYLLKEAGYQIIEAGDGTVVSRIKEIAPDMILCDIWVPHLKGSDICRIVKSDPEISHIPFILISTSMNLPEIARKCSADDYIQKPFQIAELISTVKEYLPLGNLSENGRGKN